MLARASSDAGARLHRSKSTSSVRRPPPPPPEPLDPEVAQKHALAAATTAYARAHDLDITDRARSRASTLSRSRSNASRHSEGRHFPARESSLRFSQSQKGGYVSNFKRQSITTPDGKLPRILSGTPTDTPSTQPAPSFDGNARPAAHLAPHRLSLPEPTNQIRKARSMYYASSVQTGSPVPRPPAKYLTTPPPTSPVPQRCRSFLSDLGISASTSAVTSRLPATISGNESIDKVRDRYLQDFQTRQLRQRSSFILGPFKKRQEKERNRLSSLASASVTYDSVPSVAMTSVENVKPIVNAQKEKRSFSNSLKGKIKRVFRRTSATSTSLPVQQIDASRDYFSSCVSPPPPHNDGHLDNTHSPDHTTLSHIRTQEYSSDMPESISRPGSRASSVMSNLSTSRVTSWTSSTVHNTATNRDNKRLSVIHEAKGSNASDGGMFTSSPTRCPPPAPTLSALRDPVSMDNAAHECSTPADPQRVFSALMKEIGDVDERQEDEEDSEVDDQRNSMSKRSNHSNSNSATLTNQSRVSDLSKATKATIRSVTPEPLGDSAIPARTTSVRGTVRIPREISSHDAIHKDPEQDKRLGEPHESSKPRSKRLQRPIPHASTPSADQIASRVEKSKGRWKTPLEDDHEHFPFFPKSTRRTYTVSTFARRNFSFKHSDERSPPTPSQLGARKETPTLHTSLNPRDLLSPLSPSVYSQGSDGESFRMNDSAVSLANSEADTGTAVIITSHPVKSYIIGSPQARPRAINASAKSSKDWKAWLSKEVSELEVLPQEEISFQDRFSSSGHRREHANILDGPDFSVGGPGTGNQRNSGTAMRQRRPTMGDNSERRASQGHAAIGGQSSNQAGQYRSTLEEGSSSRASWHTPPSTERPQARPTLEERPSSRMNERFPFIETGRKTSSQSSSSRKILKRRSPEADTASLRATPTPDSRVYTSYKPPPSHANTRYEPRKRVNESTGEEKTFGKENARQSVSARSLCIPPRAMSRPQSLQPLRTSVFNRSHSSLAHYTTSAEEKNHTHRHSMPPITPPTPRARPHLKSSSVSARPKSAFEIREQYSPKTFVFPADPTSDNGPRSTAHQISHIRRKPITGRALEGETLKMILTGPYPSPSPVTSPIPSPISSLWLRSNLKESATELVLDQERSMSPERQRGFEVMAEETEREGSMRSIGASIVYPGTPTAGQRMAARFLLERTVDPEIGYERIESEGIQAVESRGIKGLEPEGIDMERIEYEGNSEMTPAFL